MLLRWWNAVRKQSDHASGASRAPQADTPVVSDPRGVLPKPPHLETCSFTAAIEFVAGPLH